MISRTTQSAAFAVLHYKYATFANYSPRGTSDRSRESRNYCYSIKNGNEHLIESAVPYLRNSKADKPFLDTDVTLVPVPRSAPLSCGALWPAKTICDVLHKQGFGQDVQTYLTRIKAVQPSRLSAERPLVQAHMDSIKVRGGALGPKQNHDCG